jgi:hypothetical protein
MKIKNKLLILVNESLLRHSLYREFEDDSELYYATRFEDIIAEIRWRELDAVVIDANDESVDTIGVVQILNTFCPTVGLVVMREKNNMILDQLKELLPQMKLVITSGAPTKMAKLLSPQIRAAIRQSKRMRITGVEVTGVTHFADNFNRINEHLIITMMGINEIAAEFQLNRDNITPEKLAKMETFATDLDELLSKFRSEDDSADGLLITGVPGQQVHVQ